MIFLLREQLVPYEFFSKGATCNILAENYLIKNKNSENIWITSFIKNFFPKMRENLKYLFQRAKLKYICGVQL